MTHKRRKLLCIVFLFLAMTLSVGMQAEAKSYKNYKVSPSTKPCSKAYVKKANKDKKAKTSYMLRSYLEKIEKAGGGTLVLKKGTYKVSQNLYVPSNTTIKFEKGAKIVAQKSSTMSAVFLLVPPSKAQKNNYAGKYKSSKNVTFIGGDKAVIDLGNSTASAIFAAHNSKVSISGIQFIKRNSSKYILEISGVNNMTVENCSFTGTTQKENAVAIDIPAKKKAKTKKWCKMDDTVNKNVTIKGCTFDKLNRAIVTLRYVGKKYHTDIKIENNTISNTKDDAIRVINWKNFSVTGNKIKNVGTGGKVDTGNASIKTAIYLAGAVNPQIVGNTFENVPRPIEFCIYKNTDAKLKSYAATVNNFTNEQLQAMLDGNTLINVREYAVRVYNSQKAGDCTRHFFADDKDTYYITPSDTPYRNEYMGYDSYNKNTRHYYVFCAVMDQVERNGGGTVVVKAGTYNITNEIPIPSNTTIKLENGVVMKKKAETGTTALPSNNGIFAFVEPKHSSSTPVVYSGYGGVHDVNIVGPEQGSAIIDNNSYQTGICLVMAHCKNVKIENITFINGNGGHFIELDASTNVSISGCRFEGHVDSRVNNKEAINLDTPDKETLGFIRNWTSYDQTPNLGIKITNNTFVNQEVAIGSHSYSENKPHRNITIEGNYIDGCDGAAIQMMNWNNVTVRNNTITNVSKNAMHPYALVLSGVTNPKIMNNHISNCNMVAKIEIGKMEGKGTAADNYAPVPNVITTEEMNYLLNGNKLQNVASPVVEEYTVVNHWAHNTYNCTSN